MSIERESGVEKKLTFQPNIRQTIDIVSLASERAGKHAVIKGGVVRDILWNFYHGTTYKPRDIDFFVEGSIHKFHKSLLESDFEFIERSSRKGTPVFKYTAPWGTEVEVGILIGNPHSYTRNQTWGNRLKEEAEYTDLNVNSLSLTLEPGKSSWHIYEINDPLSVLEDIRKGEVKPTSSQAFFRSPDSILRAIRITCQLNAQFPEESLTLLHNAHTQVLRVPFHLIKREVSRILALPDPDRALHLLKESNIFDTLFPGCTIKHSDMLSIWFSDKRTDFTVVMLKPDGVEKELSDHVIRNLTEEGLALILRKRTTLKPRDVIQMYPDIQNEWLIPKIISHLTSGPCEILLFIGKDAIPKAREFVGTTTLGNRAPSGLRGKYADDFIRNIAHSPTDISELKTTLAAVLPGLPIPDLI